MKYFMWSGLILIACASFSNGLNGTDDKSKTIPIQNSIFPDLKVVPILNDEELKDGSCREVSLHKCGSSMVRVLRLLDFLPLGKSLDAKCTLRKAFFTCLKTDTEPCKKRRWSIYHSTTFRKKLLRSLWSTRRCVLGYRPAENEASNEVTS